MKCSDSFSDSTRRPPVAVLVALVASVRIWEHSDPLRDIECGCFGAMNEHLAAAGDIHTDLVGVGKGCNFGCIANDSASCSSFYFHRNNSSLSLILYLLSFCYQLVFWNIIITSSYRIENIRVLL